MIYLNESTIKSVLLHQYIKNNYSTDVIIKNNLVFCDGDIDMPPKIGCVLVKELSEYLYESLTNDLSDIYNPNELMLGDFDTNFHVKYLQNFIIPKNRFSSTGNHVAMYFSTGYISNPLDVLATFVNMLHPKGAYGSIKLDFVLYKDKIIYYIMFSYPKTIDTNTKDIIDMREALFSVTEITKVGSMVPDAQINFQKELLSQFPEINRLTNIKYEGCRVSSPCILLSDYEKYNIIFEEVTQNENDSRHCA